MSASAIMYGWRSSRYLQPTSVNQFTANTKDGGIVELFRIC